jgi:hypothetical protein
MLFAVWYCYLAVRSALYVRIHWMDILTYIATQPTVLYYITRVHIIQDAHWGLSHNEPV